MRVCDNCLGMKGSLCEVDKRTLVGPVYVIELCSPCLEALKQLRWEALALRQELRMSPGIGHQQ